MDESLSDELKRTLVRGCDFAGRDVSHMIVDSIACDLHNEGHALEGNTAIADVRWLARLMWYQEHQNSHINGFEQIPLTEQKHWERLAEIAVKCLPDLMARVAHRAVRISQALRGMERAMRLNEKVKQGNETIEFQRKLLTELRQELKDLRAKVDRGTSLNPLAQ